MTHLLTVLLSALVASLTTLILQSRGVRIWQAQERWKFKADVYARALSCLVRMREPFEVAAMRGAWPDSTNMKRALDASAELMDPAVRAELWLPEAAIRPLKSQGDRILAFREKLDTNPPTKVLLELCQLIQNDIDALVATARQDLRLSLTPAPWWKCFW
jgi:hypothetical protein